MVFTVMWNCCHLLVVRETIWNLFMSNAHLSMENFFSNDKNCFEREELCVGIQLLQNLFGLYCCNTSKNICNGEG
jgi:hypothetical protein